MGLAYTIGMFAEGPYTGGSMNPARTVGPAVAFGDLSHVWYASCVCVCVFVCVCVCARARVYVYVCMYLYRYRYMYASSILGTWVHYCVMLREIYERI